MKKKDKGVNSHITEEEISMVSNIWTMLNFTGNQWNAN